MRFIPLDILAEILRNNFYRSCCLCGEPHINLHHNLIYGGQQINEVWCILPLCPECHEKEKHRDVKDKLNWIMLNRATPEELKRYSKVENLTTKRDRLNVKFGGVFSEK